MIKSIVIGAGRISLSHLPHIINHSHIELLFIVEPNFVTRQIITRLTKIKVVKTIEEINPEIYDCAFVLTPPSSHFAITKKLLDLRKDVFVEKPLSLEPSSSRHLLTLAKKQKLALSVGYVYRFHPIYIKLKNLLSDKTYGSLEKSKISMIGNVVSDSTPISWRNTGIGSGCLYDYGCHAIDLSFYFFGKPDSVKCLSKKEIFQEGVIDEFQAEFTFRDQKDFHSNIYCNWADETVRKASINIEIKTSKNNIFCDGQTIEITGEINKTISIKDLDTNVDYYLRGEEFQLQLEDFINSINSETYDYDSVEDAVICDEYISKLYMDE